MIIAVSRHNSELVEFLRARRDFNFLKPHGRELARYVFSHLILLSFLIDSIVDAINDLITVYEMDC